jgi:hypothetical protein
MLMQNTEGKTYMNAYMKQYYINHPEKREEQLLRIKEHHSRVKLEVLMHYSNKLVPECANLFNMHETPFTDVDCLSIDHINGRNHLPDEERAAKDRGENLKGSSFYRWLRKNNYPQGYQVLCMNCQYKKEILRKRNYQPFSAKKQATLDNIIKRVFDVG